MVSSLGFFVVSKLFEICTACWLLLPTEMQIGCYGGAWAVEPRTMNSVRYSMTFG
jgi:hypothetical protein